MSQNPPNRIVCLTEETTELFYLLGEQDRIAGITTYTVRPPEARDEKPVVSSFISGSIKKINELKPDLIIGFSDIQANFASTLIKEGHNVLILNQRSIEEIFGAMHLLGRMVGRQAATEKLISGWRKKLEEVRQEVAGKPKPKVFFQEWNAPLITGICWVTELIEICGGEDIYGHYKDRKVASERIITPDDAASKEPDIILASWCGKDVDFDWILHRPEWKDMPAVKNKRIHEIDSSIILQPGPALFLEGLDAVKKYIDQGR